jgi:hypothetical protein
MCKGAIGALAGLWLVLPFLYYYPPWIVGIVAVIVALAFFLTRR